MTQLYAKVLDRSADTGGPNGWANAMAQGHRREWVAVGFAESQEGYRDAELGQVGQSGIVHASWLAIV